MREKDTHCGEKARLPVSPRADTDSILWTGRARVRSLKGALTGKYAQLFTTRSIWEASRRLRLPSGKESAFKMRELRRAPNVQEK